VAVRATRLVGAEPGRRRPPEHCRPVVVRLGRAPHARFGLRGQRRRRPRHRCPGRPHRLAAGRLRCGERQPGPGLRRRSGCRFAGVVLVGRRAGRCDCRCLCPQLHRLPIHEEDHPVPAGLAGPVFQHPDLRGLGGRDRNDRRTRRPAVGRGHLLDAGLRHDLRPLCCSAGPHPYGWPSSTRPRWPVGVPPASRPTSNGPSTCSSVWRQFTCSGRSPPWTSTTRSVAACCSCRTVSPVASSCWPPSPEISEPLESLLENME
jgi:hypothetical protein